MPRDAGHLRWEDGYLRVLWVSLACYAVIGKGFAYLGVPPLFVGELLLLAGLWLWVGARVTGLNEPSPAQLLLIGYMIWGALRTVPDVGHYGVVALRDAVVWGYGVFALVVAGLLAAEPRRLVALDVAFLGFAKMFLAVAPFLFLVGMWFGDAFPRWPGSGVPIFGPYKTGDTMVHLTGVFAYLAVCLPSLAALRPWMLVAMGVSLMANFNGRAGMVSFACGAFVVAVLRPMNRVVAGTIGMGAAALVLLWVTGLSIELPTSGRSLSFEQFAGNVASITGDTDREELSGSKTWRLAWWDAIVDYTFHGRYFWTGKGFGINLANADGFQVASDESLRSPHNGHLTILARTGVPGFALWVATQLAWALALFDAFVRAARAGERRWANLFVFLLAYWAAFIVNIAFDVYLEGPVGGIWFWCLFGVGLAAVRVHRVAPQTLREPAPGVAATPPAPGFTPAVPPRLRRRGTHALPAPASSGQRVDALPPM